MPKFCTQCGSQLSDDALYCNSCGAKVEQTEEPAAENTPTVQEVTAAQTENESLETTNDNEVSDKTAEGSEPASASVSEPEGTNETDNVSEPENNATNSQELSDTQQSKEDTTPLDKGIAFAKDKIGDGYEKFKVSPNRDKYIGFAAIGIVLIVVIAVLISIIFGGGYKSTANSYLKLLTEGGYDNLKDCTPDIIYDAVVENKYDGDEDEMEEDFDEPLIDELTSFVDIDYEILDSEKFDSDQLDGLEDSLRDEYGEYVDEKIKVSKAYEVKAKISAERNGDKETERIYFIVAKVNGDWGITDFDPNTKSSIDDYD